MSRTTTFSARLIFLALGLTYITVGILGTLPSASLIQLARNTHVSLQLVGSMFTLSSFGFMLGAITAGALTGRIRSKYLLAFGLLVLAISSTITALTSSFPLLLVSQSFKGVSYGFIDISLNTIATVAFRETLSEKLNNIHGMYGLGALLGPLLLSFSLQLFAAIIPAFLVGALVSLTAIGLLLIQMVPDLPHTASMEKAQKAESRRELRAVLRQSILWLLVIEISVYCCAEIGFGNWIVSIFSESAHMSLELAAPAATAFFVGLTLGRLGGAQLLKKGWLSESRLLVIALLSGALFGALVAIFPAQPLVIYGASILVGCSYGPLFPCLMSMASRRFAQAVGAVSSVMMIGTGATSMIVPFSMGLLIPVIGINWVMAIPAFCCLLVIVPMVVVNRAQPDSQSQLSSPAAQVAAAQTEATSLEPH